MECTNQKSTIKAILDKYNPYQIQICALLEKILNKMKGNEGAASKRTIAFLTSITDNELEILKKHFKYVTEGGILYTRDIENTMKNEGVWYNPNCSIRFYEQIWASQSFTHLDMITGKACNFNITPTQHGLIPLRNNKILLLYSSSSIVLQVYVFTAPTEIGHEIYNLVKDELEPIPQTYLDALIKQIRKTCKDVDFQIVNQ